MPGSALRSRVRTGRVTTGLVVGLAAAACGSSREKAPPAECPRAPAGCPSAAPGGAPVPEPALDAAHAKLQRLSLTLAQLDPSLHAVRLGYMRAGTYWSWRWPSWLPAGKAAALLDRLEVLVGEPPALAGPDAAIRRYVAAVRPDALELERQVIALQPATVGGARTPAPDLDAFQPLFERLGAESLHVWPALRAAWTVVPPPGTRLAVERRCLEAGTTLAELPRLERAAEAPGPTVYAPPDVAELAGLARGCALAALDHLERAGSDERVAELGIEVGSALLAEVRHRRAKGGVSVGERAAQLLSFLAERILERPAGDDG